MYTDVMRALDTAGIPYEVRVHSMSVYTTEEAARERGVRVEQIVKVMIARKTDGTLIAALIPGDKRLDVKKLGRVVGDPRISLASKAEIEETTGYTVGAISPIGMRDWRVYVDLGVLREEIVAISSGNPDAGLLLRSQDLVSFVGGTLGDFTR